MRTLKTAVAFSLRVFLFMPLALLAYLCDGTHLLFERLANCFFDLASATRQMTAAPYVRDIEKAVEEAPVREREALLEALR